MRSFRRSIVVTWTGLSRLMSDDHVFADSQGERLVGKAAALDAWRSFIAQFPDYRNHFTEMTSDGNRVSIVGHSSCAYEALAGPALWSAIVVGEHVVEWRVRSDTPQNREMLGLGTPADP